MSICVVDNGTGLCTRRSTNLLISDELRVGYSGELSPFSVIPNVVGKPRFRPLCGLPRDEPSRVGADVLECIGLYQTKRPMDHGTVGGCILVLANRPL